MKRNTLKTTKPSGSPSTRSTSKHPRCPRCGSRTVHLEQLQQELLATLSLHCLICGHHAFLGKPVVRLIRRPKIPSSFPLKNSQSA
ncbi:MAG: hypothetical protein NPIRA02_22590 [Nitrospirales bacterium]|nr:MAG: hypothetical protein NPIRA02_22590 [Nitrospirales bacterium]